MSKIQSFDGTSIHFKDWGEGRPIVFCHGNNLNSDFWQHQMVPLSHKGFRCIAYDRRGHGKSDPAASGYDYRSLARDLDAVLKALSLTDVTLVGHSTGGCDIASYLSQFGSARIARVVLVGTATPWILQGADNPDGVPLDVFEKWEADLIADQPKYYRDNAGPFFGDRASVDMIEHVLRMAQSTTLMAAVETLRSQRTVDLREDMAAFTMPTLMIHGRNDVMPEAPTVLATHRAIPHSRLVWYDDAHHGLPITHFERFNDDLAAFCR